MKQAPGAYVGIGYAEYASWEACRSSVLKAAENSSAHMRRASVEPKADTPALALGRAVHSAILEPHLFMKDYMKGLTVDKRTRSGREAWAQCLSDNPNKEILSPTEWDRCCEMRDSVWDRPWAPELLGSAGVCELSVVWDDPDSKMRCKTRLDRVAAEYHNQITIAELKTTRDGSITGFPRSVSNFNYHAQAAMQIAGLGMHEDNACDFVWIAVENFPPYEVALYQPSPEMLAQGRRRFLSWVSQWGRCLRTGEWPGYPPYSQRIELPAWARDDPLEDEIL